MTTLTIPANSLVGFTKVENGVATFEIHLPEGKYYAKDNQAVQEIEIWKDRVLYGKKQIGSKTARTPIVNKLHFNEIQFKKINERATLTEKEGYQFEYSANAKNAVFTLEDE